MRITRTTTALLGALVATVVALSGSNASAGPDRTPGRPPAARQAGSIELLTQTGTVPRGGTFDMAVRTDGLPADGRLELVLHGRVRSRSELAASMEGDGLRTQVYSASAFIAALPAAPEGGRRLTISLDPSAPGGIALTTPGAYPVEVRALDAAGSEVATLVTHLLVEPGPQDESPPLAVAVVAGIDAPPSISPEGEVDAIDADLAAVAELVAALTAQSDVPATLAVRPELVDALTLAASPESTALLDALPGAASGRSVLALPYVDVSPDALARAGLDAELDAQLERGRTLLADVLRVEPSGTSWLAAPDLGPEGVAALVDGGVRHIVIDPERLEPLRSGLLSLSLAQTFVVDADLEPAPDALALDPEVVSRVGTRASSGLELSRLLAELAVLWFEQPGIERAVVVPVDPSVRGSVVEGLLAAIDGGAIFSAVTLDDAFAAAAPLRQPGGGLVDRGLDPQRAPGVDRTVAREVPTARALLASFATLVGPDSPRAEPVANRLLLATARELDPEEQQAHLDAARAEVDAVAGAISAPARETITLTAREGTVPLTLRNDAEMPVRVVVHLRSPKLEFPDGESIPLTLTDPTTRLDIEVRTLASGSFPLEVQVTSPDGAITLSTIDFSVQSTAVSGVGVFLSAGAALFLMVWWARHWRRTRRSAKLVAPAGPVGRDVG